MLLKTALLIIEITLAVYGLLCVYKFLFIKIDSYPLLLLFMSVVAMLTFDNESISFCTLEIILICVAVYNISKKIKQRIAKDRVKRAIGKGGKYYKETMYLKFDNSGNFYYEVRDRRFSNTFLVSEDGEVKEIYFPHDSRTIYKIGDYIDITDFSNIYIAAQTRAEMRRYKKTRNYMKGNRL